MSWIKMRTDLWDDPRVAALCDKLRVGEAPVIGGLYWLWKTADQHSVDGLLVEMTPASLDRKTGLQGFAEAMEQIGWLVKESVGLRVPRFNEHNGESAKTRARNAKNQSHRRAVTELSPESGDGTVTPRVPRDRQDPSPVSRLLSPEALPAKIKDKISAEWFTTKAEPLKFNGADGSEASAFDPISRDEMLSDPIAMRDWHAYQLGREEPLLGVEMAWCLVALALGLRFANPKTTKWKSRVGVWSNAIKCGYWTQAGPYLDRAKELLRPIIFTEAK